MPGGLQDAQNGYFQGNMKVLGGPSGSQEAPRGLPGGVSPTGVEGSGTELFGLWDPLPASTRPVPPVGVPFRPSHARPPGGVGG